MAKIHTYKDARGMVWIIEQQTIPKKRGEYKFWIADTLDKKDTVKESTIKNILQLIRNKFG